MKNQPTIENLIPPRDDLWQAAQDALCLLEEWENPDENQRRVIDNLRDACKGFTVVLVYPEYAGTESDSDPETFTWSYRVKNPETALRKALARVCKSNPGIPEEDFGVSSVFRGSMCPEDKPERT